MARRRRKSNARRKAAVNPRRRRHVRRRRHNPGVVARARRVTINPRRRRHHRRRRNPSGMRIGQIFKDMVYGAGGAILTRVGASAVSGLVPSGFASNPLAGPVVEAGVAVFGVRWLGKKFLGPQQGDLMMLGGLISAGLKLADAYFPNAQAQIANIIRTPINAVQGVIAPSPAPVVGQAGSALQDVYEIPSDASAFNGLMGLGDVEDVPAGIWATLND